MTDLPTPSTLVIGGKAVDGRTIPARRYKTICADLAGDLDSAPSAAQWLIIQRAAAIAVQCEQLEVRIASGESCDVDEFVKLANTLNRLLGSIGLKQPKDGSRAKVVDAFAVAVLSGESDDE